MRLEAIQGDITQIEAEAIVNAANNRFWMGGGVAGAIKRAGGPEIEAEAMQQGPVPVGEAVATGAGRLKARYVIHAAVMGQDLATDATIIRRATASSLRLADRLGVRSLAFPALGTGVGRFPVAECARIMVDEVRLHGEGETGLERVVFVLFDEATYTAFRAELTRG